MNNNLHKAFIIMGATAFFAVAATMTVTVNSPERVEAAIVQMHKYRDVKVGEYNWGCSKGTPLRRHFEAKNEQGQDVEGSICGGRSIFPDSINVKVKNKI